MIPFNKPCLVGKETHYINDAVASGQISGNGKYTKLCHSFFEERYGFEKCLLTTSCTDALEMAAILLNIEEGDEVIMPSYTFVSTANAFVLRGAKIVFIDSSIDHPGLDENQIEPAISDRTKAIVVVHYAGVSCNMERIMDIASHHNLFVVEDAAQSVNNYYNTKSGERKPIGSFGHLAALSFHETKNIISGEGGLLIINDSQFKERAEIVWEKGTNRSAFFRNEVDKYGWVDIGSSFLPSEVVAAFLYAQLQEMDQIQEKRKVVWENYNQSLSSWAVDNKVKLPYVPAYSENNYHIFYLSFNDSEERNAFIQYMRDREIHSVFHYLSLHKSEYFEGKYHGEELVNSDRYSNCLVRLPLFPDLTKEDQKKIIEAVTSFKNLT
jgi:dTDP-4-amino-4,6-dideoxygalactose transaminase